VEAGTRTQKPHNFSVKIEDEKLGALKMKNLGTNPLPFALGS
jgi:hypothetical protein